MWWVEGIVVPLETKEVGIVLWESNDAEVTPTWLRACCRV